MNTIVDVTYNMDTDEVEMISELGFPTYYKLSECELIDANERELGVEEEYVIENVHLFFYPEGRLCDFYVDEE